MSKLYNSIASQRENVLAIYTARHPSFVSQNPVFFLQKYFNDCPLMRQVYAKPLVRKAREAEADPEAKEEAKEEAKPEAKEEAKEEVKPEVKSETKPQAKQEEVPVEAGPKTQRVIANDHFLIAFSSLKIGSVSIPVESVTVSLNDTTEKSTIEATLTSGEHKIIMKLDLSGGTWTSKLFFYNERRYYAAVPVSAYDRKSFGCGYLRLSNGKDSIYFEDIQIQPLFNPAEGQKLERFSDTANDCVGFFSASILGALFVVFILVMILSCGLTMIMDIRTMDRFDDPKGKTITINAQE